MSLKTSMGQMFPSGKGNGVDLRYQISIRSEKSSCMWGYLLNEISFFFRRHDIGNVVARRWQG